MWFAKQKIVKYGENRKCKSNIYVIIVDYVIVFQAYLKLRMKWCVQEKKRCGYMSNQSHKSAKKHVDNDLLSPGSNGMICIFWNWQRA